MARLAKAAPEYSDPMEAKLAQYGHDPLRYATKLTDPKIGQYRFRIGDYRIVFDLREDELMILAVAHRKDIYR
jgi:mRNA interferase RelE/StbE